MAIAILFSMLLYFTLIYFIVLLFHYFILLYLKVSENIGREKNKITTQKVHLKFCYIYSDNKSIEGVTHPPIKLEKV